MITAVVGAGGKTTLIKKLAGKYREEGKTVLVTTTTHMFAEEDTLIDVSAEEIIRQLEENDYAMAGTSAEQGKKITALPEDVYEEVCRYADEVLVEADGSRNLPLKYPAEHEPVIPDNAEEIIVVCGLAGLGKPVKEVCQRPELVKECLGIDDDTVIKPVHVQRLLQEGYLKPLRASYPDAHVRLHVTHEDNLYHRALAALIKMEQDVIVIKEEWFCPQPKLIICGGGHVAKEVAAFASELDFYVKVIDDRSELVTEERFPTADERICDSFDNLGKYLERDAYYVVVTPDHKADYQCVKTILPTDYRYLGMIGSRKKVANTRLGLEEEGFSAEKINSIFTPIGLAIGAVTPAEIAISILAQIIQVKNVQHAASADTELLTAKEPGVLCIITEKQGSAPRGIGSMMLVGHDRVLGSIGGGQAEFAAIEHAKNMSGFSLKEYNLNTADYDDQGMICGGRIKLMFVALE